ncbi:MAG TPA: hypothetical protein VGN73_03145 [Gemmatimonadaceae bacterium]|nr:hypothetical protein [Gemmatimonadaceae bacterium]
MPDHSKAVYYQLQPVIRAERIMCFVPHWETIDGIELELVDYSPIGIRILLDPIEKFRNRKLGRRRRIRFAFFASDDGVLPNGQEWELLGECLGKVAAKTVRV